MVENGSSILKQTTPAGPVSDFIVMGLQTSIWIVLLFMMIFKNFNISNFVKDISILLGIIITLFAIMIFYSLGVIVDLLAADFFEFICKKSRNPKLAYGKSNPVINLQIMKDNKYIHYYLTGLSSRLRIAKTTFFNFPIIAITMLLYLCLNEMINCFQLLILLIMSICFWYIIARYCIKRDVHYHNSVHIANSVITGKKLA